MKNLLPMAMAATLGVGGAFAQDYPTKTIRMVTSAVGSGNDFATRLITPGMSALLGQPVIPDNQGGAVSSAIVSKAPPDGYTVLMHGTSFWVAPLLQKMSYDVLRDFSPVTIVAREFLMLAVNPSLPVKSVRELIALAKARPGELNFGTAGPGTTPHLAVELFKSMAGLNLVHIPYKGSGGAMTALISGEVQMMITDAGLLEPHVKSGRVRPLAVTSLEPSVLAPGMPTMAASGVPGYESAGMTVVVVPAKTPAAIINRLNQVILQVLKSPDVKEKFLSSGSDVVGSSPEQVAAAIKSEIAKWGKVVKDAGLKAE